MALVAAVVGIALLRIFARRREALIRLRPFRQFLRSYNTITQRISGVRGSTLGLLTHVGRRSGRSYQTSLGVAAYGDGFLVPLTYGARTDWYRNIMAGGGGTLTWQARTHRIERPEVISGPEPMRAWPLGSRLMLRLAGVHDFVWLHDV